MPGRTVGRRRNAIRCRPCFLKAPLTSLDPSQARNGAPGDAPTTNRTVLPVTSESLRGATILRRVFPWAAAGRAAITDKTTNAAHQARNRLRDPPPINASAFVTIRSDRNLPLDPDPFGEHKQAFADYNGDEQPAPLRRDISPT
jgi:hypothetical protein